MRQIYWSLMGLSICLANVAGAGDAKGKKGAYQWVTGDRVERSRTRWDKIFNTKKYVYGRKPSRFLVKNLAHLPAGRALDIAMGEGRNAVFLAQKGFAVEGVDFSRVALRKARTLAREHGVSIKAMYADLRKYTIKRNYYDVILIIQYLQRDLVPQIRAALKPGGVVVLENYTVDQRENDKTVPADSMLEKGELKRMFEGFEIIVHEETNDGKEALAAVVARKPR